MFKKQKQLTLVEELVLLVVLLPLAGAFMAAFAAWSIARDLQRTRVGRLRPVRRLLVWVAGKENSL